jgi:AcrR family transcriptional regulator
MARTESQVTKARTLAAAMILADAHGLPAVSMRSIATSLDVSPMSLYHHVRNKRELLDGMVELVLAEISIPVVGDRWRGSLERRAGSMRSSLTRHPWSVPLLNARSTLETLRHLDAVIGCLRAERFSMKLAAHASSLIDSFVHGSSLRATAHEDFLAGIALLLDGIEASLASA